MKKFIFAAIFLAMMLMTAGAYAQTSTTTGSISAIQTLGVQNTQILQQGLAILGATLNRANAMLASQPQNLTNINPDLNAIRGSLLAIHSTIAVLNGNAPTFAAGTPGLPNTGGGGAALFAK